MHDRRRVQAELVAREQDARAEALDLQAARGLGVEAVPEPAGREDGERQDDEHGDGCEHAERAQRAAATCDLPDVDRRERDDDQGIELRRRSEPEQAEAEQLAAAQDSGERSDRERCREEVVGVERDRANGDRREREQDGRPVQTVLRGAERDEREQDGEERRDPAERHQRLESRVVGAPGQNGRRKEHRERSRRVLDEDVAVGQVAAQEAVGVDAVDVDVAVPLGAEEAAVGNRAGEEEQRRGERRDARGQPRAGVDGYGCGGGGGGAAGGGSAGGGGGFWAGGGGGGVACVGGGGRPEAGLVGGGCAAGGW